MPQDKQVYIDGMVSIANAVFYAEEKDYVMIID